jgi:hypothetical protein
MISSAGAMMAGEENDARLSLESLLWMLVLISQWLQMEKPLRLQHSQIWSSMQL